MKNESTLRAIAVKHFLEGYNCAQSVLMTMIQQWDGQSELVPKIATGFGGGMGRCGSVCGALTGGVMALGVKYGSNEPSSEKREKTYKLVWMLYKHFEQKHRSVLCRELIGYDLSDPVDLEEARKSKVFETKCSSFIQTVMGFLLSPDEHTS